MSGKNEWQPKVQFDRTGLVASGNHRIAGHRTGGAVIGVYFSVPVLVAAWLFAANLGTKRIDDHVTSQGAQELVFSGNTRGALGNPFAH